MFAADVRWTLLEDKQENLHLREAKNTMIKMMLKSGKSVQYRSSGWSLHPRVHSSDLCMYEPVTTTESVQEGDIVFCEVQPSNRSCSHLVKHKYQYPEHDPDGKTAFTISRLDGHEN